MVNGLIIDDDSLLLIILAKLLVHDVDGLTRVGVALVELLLLDNEESKLLNASEFNNPCRASDINFFARSRKLVKRSSSSW